MSTASQFQLEPILKGKPHVDYTVAIELHVSGVCMTNDNTLVEKFPSDAIIEVTLDKQPIYQGAIGSDIIELKCTVVDSGPAAAHCLKIRWPGLEDHVPWHDNLNPTVRLNKLAFEGVSLLHILNTVSRYVGDSGEITIGGKFIHGNGQLEINFTTPMYRWLLENYK